MPAYKTVDLANLFLVTIQKKGQFSIKDSLTKQYGFFTFDYESYTKKKIDNFKGIKILQE